MKRELNRETALRLLRYEPETGRLFWREREECFFLGSQVFSSAEYCRMWNKLYAGKEAFTAKTQGYRVGAILCQFYRAHRVIWLMHYGAWPEHQIDHINGDRSDNRIANLRSVTNVINHRNTKIHTRNRSGVSGVSLKASTGRWMARIKVLGKETHLGYFADKDAAIAARRSAESSLGYHPNHGRR